MVRPGSPSRSRSRGLTLIELCSVVVIIAIVITFAAISFSGSSESRDAAMVQSAQVGLQQVISQGSSRLDKSPQSLVTENSSDILNALRDYVGGSQSVTYTLSGGTFNMAINASGRGARYKLDTTNNVVLDSLSGVWSNYMVQNGVITKK
ncbi:MAG: prepilin-type N-terminal cleavage/methylation domain-containing protein [Candidatus Melainabacteria bacterium]